ncbi:hypothetical protein LINPERPRIM_LOCUS5806, partial [Linum perenne]
MIWGFTLEIRVSVITLSLELRLMKRQDWWNQDDKE